MDTYTGVIGIYSASEKAVFAMLMQIFFAAIKYLPQTSASSVLYTTMSFIHRVINNQFQSFLRSRMLAYQDGLTAYVEAQIKTARDTYTLLAKTMTVLKQMEE